MVTHGSCGASCLVKSNSYHEGVKTAPESNMSHYLNREVRSYKDFLLENVKFFMRIYLTGCLLVLNKAFLNHEIVLWQGLIQGKAVRRGTEALSECFR